MHLVGEDGKPLNTNKKLVDHNGETATATKQLVDESGEGVSSEKPAPLTTKKVGEQFASHLLQKAMEAPTGALVNNQFDVLYHMALNVIAHRILNVGLGMEQAQVIVEWNEERANVSFNEVREHLNITVEEWKQRYFNGELQYKPAKQ